MTTTRRIVGIVVAGTLAAGVGLIAAPAVQATTKFTNCTNLLKVYPHGISKSKAAADRAVRNGQHRPAVKPTVYADSYKTLDRDDDGSMCEQPA
jgi:hypothetical protein